MDEFGMGSLGDNCNDGFTRNPLPSVLKSLQKDGYFSELKTAEILRERLNLANEVSPYIGKYFSVEYIRKNVLRQSDEDIIEIDSQIRNEIKQGIIAAPEGQDMQDDSDDTDINIGDN